ncbi:HDOD domain-containing protein [Thermodesulfobacteriota bacterium]
MFQDDNRFFDQISTSRNLPSLPHILLRLIETCNNERSTIQDITKIISKDSSLTAKVLRLVNSAYYGLPNRIGDIDQALTLLGTEAVKNIAISTSVHQAFNHVKDHAVFRLKSFWRHSLLCAQLARLIAKKASFASPEEAFLSGLLHDIGKLVLWVNFNEEYIEILKSSGDRADRLLEAERRLGATHGDVGAWLIDRWALQSFMADAALYHHEPVERIQHAFPLVKIVYAANLLCPETHLDTGLKHEVIESLLGYNGSETEEMRHQAQEEVLEVAQSLGIDIEPFEPSLSVTEGDDQNKYEQLAGEVRDVSLLVGTLQNLMRAENQEAILRILHQGLEILFDVKSIFFFLHEPDKDVLVGKAGIKNKKVPSIKDLIVHYQIEKSLLIQSLHQGRPLDSFDRPDDAAPVILDEQIVRFMGREGILCLPMISQGEDVGLIVVGLDRAEFPQLRPHFRLLNTFTGQAAQALHLDSLRRSRLKTIQSERIRASAALARKMSHEVNNPLGIIKNYLKILGIKLSEKNIAQDEIRIINEEIDRVTEIIRELTAFSEEKVTRKEPVNINALLSDLLKIMGQSVFKDSGIEVHLDLDPSHPTVLAEKNGLKQVFINLFQNAAEAAKGKGNLYIRTQHISNPAGDPSSTGPREFEEPIRITVRDDGSGIPDELKPRIFEPFTSSKGGDHTGLGLSITHNIIQSLDGTITCDSRENGGTVFQIDLPIFKSEKT